DLAESFLGTRDGTAFGPRLGLLKKAVQFQVQSPGQGFECFDGGIFDPAFFDRVQGFGIQIPRLPAKVGTAQAFFFAQAQDDIAEIKFTPLHGLLLPRGAAFSFSKIIFPKLNRMRRPSLRKNHSSLVSLPSRSRS